jgi:hypothetical protein
MQKLDSFIIGELCIDEVVSFDGSSEFSIGGAVVYSSFSALAGGNQVGILIKSGPREKMMAYLLPVRSDRIFWRESATGTSSIRNVFLDDKRSAAPPPPWPRAARSRLRSCRRWTPGFTSWRA